MSSKKPKEYLVGFKRPPKATQFRRGQSGNPKGRPKGTKNLATDLEEELGEQVLVKEGGSQRKVSKQRAMLKAIFAGAMRGDARAFAQVMNLIARLIQLDPPGKDASEISAEDQAILDAFLAQHVKKPEPSGNGG